MRNALLTLTALVALLLTGCASTAGETDDAPQAGTNRPATDAAPAAAPTEAPPPPAEDGPLAFGETFTYEDGVSLTVGPPQPFTPSQYAAGAEGYPAAVVFDVTVVNGGTTQFDPTLFMATVQSANQEGSQIFDQDLQGAPQTTLLPGREAKFRVGFAVHDPADLVLEAAPSFTHDPAIYASAP